MPGRRPGIVASRRERGGPARTDDRGQPFGRLVVGGGLVVVVAGGTVVVVAGGREVVVAGGRVVVVGGGTIGRPDLF